MAIDTVNDRRSFNNLGLKFIPSGLGFFVFGLLLGFGILGHYLVGSKWDFTEQFLNNMTLWFASPLTLSVGMIQLGGLAMAVIGLVYIALGRFYPNYVDLKKDHVDLKKDYTALTLCIIGLVALFLTGVIGYFIIDSIWPAFYYDPQVDAKNLWLILQGLSLLIYFVGVVISFITSTEVTKDTVIDNNRTNNRYDRRVREDEDRANMT